MIQHLSRLLCALLLVTLISSCETDTFFDDEEDGGQPGAAVFGIRGDLTLADYEAIATNNAPYNTDDYPDFSPVVCFTYSINGSDDYEFVASGVLVKDDWILTAGHNFFVSDEQNRPADVRGILVNTGIDPNNPDDTYEVSELVFHPTWLEDDDVFGKANDLCLVKLTRSVTGIQPAQIYSTTDETIGAVLWYAGYGDYSTQPGQNPDLYSKKHAIQNTLDRKVSGIQSSSSAGVYTGGLLAYDFDSPSEMHNSLGDNFSSEEEDLLGTGRSNPVALVFEGSTVEGDSGGPIFLKKDNVWQVCGILSGGASEPVPNYRDGDYGGIDFYIRTSTAINWINSVIN